MDLIKKIGAVVFALALLVGVVILAKPTVKAAGQHADLHAAMLVSTDNGQTWRSGEPSICVKPGADLLVLYKIWNAGDLEVKSVTGYSTVTNGEYINENVIVNADQDGDGHSFVFDDDSADFVITNLQPNGSENERYQGIITTANLTDNIPCDTNIKGSVTLTNFRTGSSSSDRQIMRFFGRALATDNRLALTTTFTLNINSDSCPKTCGATVTTLPQTGSSILELVESVF